MILIHLESDIPCFTVTDAQAERFRANLGSYAPEIRICRSNAEFVGLLPEATAVFVWTFRQEWFALAPKLQHICTPAAGRDYFKVSPPPGVEMHYGSFHGAIMGETALGAVLSFCHGLLPFSGAMHSGNDWPRAAMALRSRRLCGSNVAILGYGNIGRIFAKMLAPFGAAITGITRRHHPELASEAAALGVTLVLADSIDSVLPNVDHLVCFLPSGPDTDNLIDARRIALMKPTAAIYNFGRGNLIDEDALAKALSAGLLGGAVLDVFREEPLPASSPLRRAPNCWLYPHASAFSPDYLDLYFEKCVKAIKKQVNA